MSPRASSAVRLHATLAWLVLACALLSSRAAYALDRRTDAAAKQEIAQAAKDHAAGDDDGALLRLQKTLRTCGSNRCSTPTRAALLRDVGVIQFARGDRAKATASFGEALDLAADLPWNAAYDSADAVAEWAAVKDERAALHETLPEGDLEHVPESEQAVNTPLPVYAETSAPGVARVVVKYRAAGDTEFKRKNLPRFGGGWGGTIPCSDVKRGLLRYFLQAFDAEGTPIGNSGDIHHLYFVPIRWTLVGEPPHLPGRAPPETCGAGHVEQEAPADTTTAPAGGAAVGGYVHLWIGFAGSVDLTTVPSATDVCALNAAGTPASSSFYCTNPDGSDFPTRPTPTSAGNARVPVLGRSGVSNGGIVTGDVRLLVTLDYAVNANFMTGARVGYVDQSYPGAAAGNDGHGATAPIHLELRETYLFGNAPLARSGFAPYVFFAGGYAKADTSQISAEEVLGVTGQRPVVVWKIGGPYFVAAGVGARYAFSPRVALLTGIKAALPFGSGGILPSIAPELELQYGF